jgi:uncharacterized protein
MESELKVDGLRLVAHIARPPTGARTGKPPGLVLCHGFPAGPPDAAPATTGGRVGASTYPQLADRVAAETGYVVLTFNFRGTGGSEGDFSLAGWEADVGAAIEHMCSEERVADVWLAGSSTGGSVVISAAAHDDRVKGVATLAAPADFDDWTSDPRAFLEHCRRVGAIRTSGYPSDMAGWVRELRAVRPLDAVATLPPRAVLVLHGSDDDVVPVADARALVDATDDHAELRIINGGGHRLRHDPRAVAILLGWLVRQAG